MADAFKLAGNYEAVSTQSALKRFSGSNEQQDIWGRMKKNIFLSHYSHHTNKVKRQQRKDLYMSAVISQGERWMVSEDDLRVLLSECSWKHIQLRSLITLQEQNWTKSSKMTLLSFMKAETQIISHMVVEYFSCDFGSFLAKSTYI